MLSASNEPGASPATFIDMLISHRAVQFQPHPGVLARIYDFQFGRRGLSLMHFFPISQMERMDCVIGETVNMQNFTASIEAPRALKPTSVAAIQACLRTCAGEFLTTETVQLVDRMFSFVQELTTWEAWEADDLPYLVYWLNQVLEDYRAGAGQDSLALTSERLRVIDQLNTKNGELHPLFQVVNA